MMSRRISKLCQHVRNLSGHGHRACNSNRKRGTAVVYHDCFLSHGEVTHPENANRYTESKKALQETNSLKLHWVEAPLATENDILRVHDHSVLRTFKMAVEKAKETSSPVSLDPDTTVTTGSKEAAFRAAGAVIKAVDLVCSDKEIRNAFCLVRPPGHHATINQSMGFCFFNNVAVGLKYAREKYSMSKIAVLDWDVHHGNGTQDILFSDPTSKFISFHQYPFYPGSGSANEVGEHDNILNIPLDMFSDGKVVKEYFESLVMPTLIEFQPDLLFISCGFDAHADDPLGNLRLQSEDFVYMTKRLKEIASHEGRVISVLEGGYNIEKLAECVRDHVVELGEQ